MTPSMDNGWSASAEAWVAHLGDAGDRGRKDILDRPMLAAVRDSGARRALDVGCGEGRFCRMLRGIGLDATGIDPTPELLDLARTRDPEGGYLDGKAEALAFEDGAFDLVVSYLTLIDIPDYRAAIGEMARVLAPSGTLLVANLNPFVTAIPRTAPKSGSGWVKEGDTRLYYAIDDYVGERGNWVEWSGIRILNYHRPLSDYMAAFLTVGLVLQAYEEPGYQGSDPDVADKYKRIPWFNMMVWRKPGEGD